MTGTGTVSNMVMNAGLQYATDPNFRQQVNEHFDMVKDGATRVSSGLRGRGRGGGGGDAPIPVSQHAHSSGYSLTSAVKPKPVSLDSGIRPNTYTNDLMAASENNCVPLHMTTTYFKFPDYSAAYLYTYFLQISAFDLQSKAQANVGFNIDLTAFSQTNILTAMNSLVYALQVYYYYRSIISYRSMPGNKNEGMVYLRSNITPTIQESLNQLEHRLSDTPCPPNLLEFIRYLMGNFQSGQTPGSALLKFCPVAASDTCVDASVLTAALTQLTASNSVYTLMRRAIPQWRPIVLYDIEPTPLFDNNFKTMFANQGFLWYNGTTSTQSPSVSAESDVIAYNSYTDSLDGVAYAMTSMWSTAVTQRLPGLMQPVGGSTFNGDTRVSFYQVSNVSKFYSATAYPYISRSRPETYIVNDTRSALNNYHLDGAVKCQSVSSLTIRDTGMKVINYLLSADTIINPDVKATLTGRPSKSSNRSRSGKKK